MERGAQEGGGGRGEGLRDTVHDNLYHSNLASRRNFVGTLDFVFFFGVSALSVKEPYIATSRGKSAASP